MPRNDPNLISRRRHPDGRVLEIRHDPEPLDPRKEQDNLGTMVCFHRRYRLGDQHKYRQDDYGSWEGLRDDLERDFGPNARILPLYLYDHSGLRMSTGPFSCPWDSGQVGYIVASDAALVDAGVPDPDEALRQEVATYNQYLSGDVYGFQLFSADATEEDACWGFYGDPDKSGMAEHIKNFAEFVELADNN